VVVLHRSVGIFLNIAFVVFVDPVISGVSADVPLHQLVQFHPSLLEHIRQFFISRRLSFLVFRFGCLFLFELLLFLGQKCTELFFIFNVTLSKLGN